MENSYSNLMHDDEEGVLSLILSLIGLNITTSLHQMKEFLSKTLLYVQQQQLCVEKSLWEVVQQSVELLREKDLITGTSDGQTLQVTKLDTAASKDLSRGLEGLLLNSYLHLLYLVTSYDLISQCESDWMSSDSDSAKTKVSTRPGHRNLPENGTKPSLETEQTESSFIHHTKQKERECSQEMEEFRTIVASLNSELEDVHRGTTGAEALKFIRLEINILELFAISADLRTSGTARCRTEVVNQYNKMLGEFEAMKKRLQTPNDPSFREGSDTEMTLFNIFKLFMKITA
ncbi:hypothetical protein Q8A73_019405 [Channa argus]|nr:hypothetical protein Q8A73_019405 [Channa argus]